MRKSWGKTTSYAHNNVKCQQSLVAYISNTGDTGGRVADVANQSLTNLFNKYPIQHLTVLGCTSKLNKYQDVQAKRIKIIPIK